MRDNKNLITILIVFIILAVVVVFYWNRQQRRIFQQSQAGIQAGLLEEWGPGAQQQIQRALAAQPAAFSSQVSYKNIIARVAPSVVSVNVDTGIFNNAAQQAKIQPMAQSQQPLIQNWPADQSPASGGAAQYVWGGPMGNFGTGVGGYWSCPNCYTSMPCRGGFASSAINCPSCGVLMNRSVSPAGGQQDMQQQQQNIQQFQAAGKGGSGVIISSSGYVLTNHHVIHGAKKIAVTVYSGQTTSKTYQADLIDEAPELDFAILKIAGKGEVFAPAPIGSSSSMSVGDEVLAIGSPFGLPQTTTFGIVSNTRRTMTVGNQTFTDFIQTDAPTNPGSSGGALVNVKGEVIGINTAIYSPTRAFSGIGFARPIDSAKAAFSDFMEAAGGQGTPVAFQRGTGLNSWRPPGGRMQQVANAQAGKCWMGIRTRPVDQQTKASLGLPMTRGVVVSEIFADSPCLAAGLQTGDVIIRLDNRSLKNETMLGDLLAAKSIGDEVKLAVYRDGKKTNLRLRLGPRPGDI